MTKTDNFFAKGSFTYQLTPIGWGGGWGGKFFVTLVSARGRAQTSDQSISWYFEKVHIKSRSVNLTKKREKMSEIKIIQAKKR